MAVLYLAEQPFSALMKGLNQRRHSNMNVSPVTSVAYAAGQEVVFFTFLGKDEIMRTVFSENHLPYNYLNTLSLFTPKFSSDMAHPFSQAEPGLKAEVAYITACSLAGPTNDQSQHCCNMN